MHLGLASTIHEVTFYKNCVNILSHKNKNSYIMLRKTMSYNRLITFVRLKGLYKILVFF